MKPYRIFVGLAAAVLLGGCAGRPETAAEPTPAPAASTGAGTSAPAEAARREAGSVSVEITPPAGWEPVAGSVLDVQYQKETASFMVKTEDFGGADLDDVVRQAEAIFTSSFEELRMTAEPEAFTVDGKDARQMIFTCTISGLSMEYWYVYLYASDNLYAITFGDAASAFDSRREDFQIILDTIRFVS